MSKAIYVAVDFDGTIVKHDYPRIGEEVPGAIDTMKKLHAKGAKLILFTMRSKETLAEAVAWLHKRGITLAGVNKNPTQWKWSESPKAYAHIYIDDAALGCPLIHEDGERPYVDWEAVESMLPADLVL